MGYGKHDAKVRALVAAMSGDKGHLPAKAREALLRREAPDGEIGAIAKQVVSDATRVTDEMFAKAIAKGATEDELFEAVTVSAVGAALKRLEKGLSLLDAPKPTKTDGAP
jgi:hypothetical protein